jgi:hypothetical protein
MKIKFIFICYLILIITTKNSYTKDNFAENVSNKLAMIISKEGPITIKDYNEFWNATGIKSRDQKALLISNLRADFVNIHEFNNALWDCAERSWIANRPVNCNDLKSKFNVIKNAISKYENEKNNIENMEKNFQAIIKSAELRGKFNAKDFENNNLMFQDIDLDKIKSAKIKSQLILLKTNAILQLEFSK